MCLQYRRTACFGFDLLTLRERVNLAFVSCSLCRLNAHSTGSHEQAGTALRLEEWHAIRMNEPIHHHQAELLESLVAGKLPRNLSWSAVVELIGQIGAVQATGNNEYTFLVRSERAYFKRPGTHNLEVEEISRLRKFLKQARIPMGKVSACRNG